MDGLAGALERLLDDPTLAAKMGSRGRKKVLQQYTWDHQYARLCDVVNQLMKS